MIPYIDEALQRWAEAQASAADCTSNMGNSVIASLMASQGVLNRAARGSRVLVDRATEIDWIVKQAPFHRAAAGGRRAVLQQPAFA